MVEDCGLTGVLARDVAVGSRCANAQIEKCVGKTPPPAWHVLPEVKIEVAASHDNRLLFHSLHINTTSFLCVIEFTSR